MVFVGELAMSTFDVILHPTDFSDDSEQSLLLACSVARDQFASLVVVHVLSPECCPGRVSDDEPINDAWPVVRSCHDRFCHLKALAGESPISFRIVVGYPVGAILNIAHEENADLIVIASHQQSSSHIQLHGSVAEGLLRQTHCPVLVLRAPAQASQLPSRTA